MTTILFGFNCILVDFQPAKIKAKILFELKTITVCEHTFYLSGPGAPLSINKKTT